MSIRVISAGLWTTIQDKGRFGYAAYGVPESGAMDSYCFDFVNLLLQNSSEAAVMEITMQGPKLLFEEDTIFVVVGLEAHVFLEGTPVELNQVHEVRKGQILDIKSVTQGTRLYLGVKNGFKTDKVLGSHSFYKPITRQNRLEKEDVIGLNSSDTALIKQNAVLKFDEERYTSDVIQVYPGPEWQDLSKDIQQILLSVQFSISNKNSRMAYQLEEKIQNNLKGIITQPVLPGTVQLTPSGSLIILMRDCQVTGGYPRVFQLAESSIDKLAQKKRGDRILFDRIKYTVRSD